MQPVYVSLTTISSRLDVLDVVVHSLMNQTRPADKIILNISLEPFMLDRGIRFEDLPPRTRAAAASGTLELYYCRNTGPYRKVLPVLDRFADTDYLIATADDDVAYPPEWLEVLVATALEYRCIAAYRCREMTVAHNRLGPYNDWPLVTGRAHLRNIRGRSPSLSLFPTGRDGVIYSSDHFRDKKALAHLQAIAPAQDDLAFKFLTLLQGVPVALAPREATSAAEQWEFPEAGGGRKATLWDLNRHGENDAAAARIAAWCATHRNFRLEALSPSEA
ncbi:hypothetical protein [Xanthobacter sediminis]